MDDHYIRPTAIAAMAAAASLHAQLWAAYDLRSLPLEAADERAELELAVRAILEALA
mgnify:CR=1 FL=1